MAAFDPFADGRAIKVGAAPAFDPFSDGRAAAVAEAPATGAFDPFKSGQAVPPDSLTMAENSDVGDVAKTKELKDKAIEDRVLQNALDEGDAPMPKYFGSSVINPIAHTLNPVAKYDAPASDAAVEAYVPLHGAGDAWHEGMVQGDQLLGDTISGKIAGAALGGIGVVGSAFNPVGAGAKDIIKQPAALANLAMGNDAIAAEQASPDGKLIPGLNPAMTGDVGTNMLSDLGVGIAQDPLNHALIAAGVGEMGAGLRGRIAGRQGQTLPPNPVFDLFPEATAEGWKKGAVAERGHGVFGPLPTGEILNVGGPKYELPPRRAFKDLTDKELETEMASVTQELAKETDPALKQVGENLLKTLQRERATRPPEIPVEKPVEAAPEPAPVAEAPKPAEEVTPPVAEAPATSTEQLTAKPSSGQEEESPLISKRTKKDSLDTLDENEHPTGTKPAEKPQGVSASVEQAARPAGSPVVLDAPADSGAGVFAKAPPSGVTGLLRSVLEALGVKLDESQKGGPVTGHAPDGTVTVKFNEGDLGNIKHRDFADGAPNRGAAVANLAKVAANHEVIHAALLKAWSDEWKERTSMGEDLGDFNQFVRSKTSEIHNDIANTVSTMPTSMASLVKKALYDSWNTYHQGKSQAVREGAAAEHPDQFAGITSPEALLEHLKKNPDQIKNFIFEFLRQLKEVKDEKVTSEAAWRNFIGRVTDYLRNALVRIQKASDMAHRGQLGEKVKAALETQDSSYNKAVAEAGKKGEIAKVEFQPMKFEDMAMSLPADDPLLQGAKTGDDSYEIYDPLHDPRMYGPKTGEQVNEKKLNDILSIVGARVVGAEKIDPWWKRNLLENALRPLDRAGGGLADLAQRIRDYKNEAAAMKGRLGSYMQKVWDDAKSGGALDVARKEFRDYMQAREEYRVVKPPGLKLAPEALAKEQAGFARADELYAKASPHGKAWIDAAKRVARDTSAAERTIGVRVVDPYTGEIRPAGSYGENYWPKMLSDKVKTILENKTKYADEYRKLLEELVAKNPEISIQQAADIGERALSWDRSGAYKDAHVDFGRTNFLPGGWYEYGFEEALPTFNEKFSERIAQVKHFGQTLETPNGRIMDVFQRLHRKVNDVDTKNYIKALSEAIYGHKDKGWRQNMMARVRAYMIITKLATGVGAVKNLASVTGVTVPMFGINAAMRGAYALMKNYGGELRKAQEAGSVLHDLQVSSAEVWDLNKWQRKAVDFSLKATGFSLTEQFNRVHAAATAIAWGKWALNKIESNPTSRAARQSQAVFDRYGIDAKILKAEGFDGNMAKKLMREAVNSTQFAYDVRQVPLWMETPLSKFYFQFQKFGVQMVGHVWNNVMKPAIVGSEWEISPGNSGKIRDFKPLIYTMIGATGSGEFLLTVFRPLLFGKDRKDANWTEIANALHDNDAAALSLLAHHLLNNFLYVGAAGTLGDAYSGVADYTKSNRTRDFLAPTAYSTLDNFWNNVIQPLWQQKALSTQDLKRAITREAPLLGYALSAFNNAVDDPTAGAQRKLSRIRSLGFQYSDEAGLDRPAGTTQYAKTPRTPAYNALQEALLNGDAQTAKGIVDGLIKDAKTISDRNKIIKSIKSSANARRPMKVGTIDTDNERADFAAFVLKRAGPEEFKNLQELEATYAHTANAVLHTHMHAPTEARANSRLQKVDLQLAPK